MNRRDELTALAEAEITRHADIADLGAQFLPHGRCGAEFLRLSFRLRDGTAFDVDVGAASRGFTEKRWYK